MNVSTVLGCCNCTWRVQLKHFKILLWRTEKYELFIDVIGNNVVSRQIKEISHEKNYMFVISSFCMVMQKVLQPYTVYPTVDVPLLQSTLQYYHDMCTKKKHGTIFC